MRPIERVLVLLAALATAGLLALPAWSGECLSARVPGSLVLPDGSQHDAATLRICSMQAMTPATTLHRAYVDGQVVGMFFGRETDGDALPVMDARAYVVFERDSDGALELEGFAYASGHGMRYFTAQSIRTTPRVIARDQFASAEPPARVILAAALSR